MANSEYHMIGHTILRIVIGLLFFIMGINKLSNPDEITGMLASLGFPIAALFAWILILSEIIFGVLIFVGYKTKYTAWPLALILVVAWLLVVLPKEGISSTNSFFHLIAIAGLITIALTGSGKYAITKD